MRRIWLVALFPVLLAGLAFVCVRFLTCVIANPEKAWHMAFMIDETCNVGANGEVNITISARAARARNAGRLWGRMMCWFLARFQCHHCDKALADLKSRLNGKG